MNIDNFEVAAVARDLQRNPDVKLVAWALCRMYLPHGVTLDKENIPPIYIMLAHTLVKNKLKRDLFLSILESAI